MGKHFEELMALWPELRKAGAMGGREGVVRVRGRKLPGGVVLFQLSVPSTSQVEAPRGCHQPHGFVFGLFILPKPEGERGIAFLFKMCQMKSMTSFLSGSLHSRQQRCSFCFAGVFLA